MTDRDKGLNPRKLPTGRLVEAHMALICGRYPPGFSVADFDPSIKGRPMDTIDGHALVFNSRE